MTAGALLLTGSHVTPQGRFPTPCTHCFKQTWDTLSQVCNQMRRETQLMLHSAVGQLAVTVCRSHVTQLQPSEIRSVYSNYWRKQVHHRLPK